MLHSTSTWTDGVCVGTHTADGHEHGVHTHATDGHGHVIKLVNGECGQCKNCLDKKKFGGPGIKKQPCMYRPVTQELLQQQAERQ